MLKHGEGPLVADSGFADQGEVLIKTRQASELLGATKVDRPEWIAVDARGHVHCTLTNNSNRGDGRPRSATAAIRRIDGGVIGTCATRRCGPGGQGFLLTGTSDIEGPPACRPFHFPGAAGAPPAHTLRAW